MGTTILIMVLCMGIFLIMAISLYVCALILEYNAQTKKKDSVKEEVTDGNMPASIVGKSHHSTSTYIDTSSLMPNHQENSSNKQDTTNSQESIPEDEQNEMDIDYEAEEDDDEQIMREELLLFSSYDTDISPTAIMTRELERMYKWSSNDDVVEQESESITHTIKKMSGTQILEKYKAQMELQEHNHRKLLEIIRRAELQDEASEQNSETDDDLFNSSDTTNDKPLSYYL